MPSRTRPQESHTPQVDLKFRIPAGKDNLLCKLPAVYGSLSRSSFLCPRCRAGLCKLTTASQVPAAETTVSMPSLSGWALQGLAATGALQKYSFYALVVGLGFAR